MCRDYFIEYNSIVSSTSTRKASIPRLVNTRAYRFFLSCGNATTVREIRDLKINYKKLYNKAMYTRNYNDWHSATENLKIYKKNYGNLELL